MRLSCKLSDLIWGYFHPFILNRFETTTLFVHSPPNVKGETQSRWTDDLLMCSSYHEPWRRRCEGALMVTLSVIYLEFKAHLTSMATTAFCSVRHPIWFAFSGTVNCFSTGQWPNTPPGCVRAIWPRRRVMECCIRWPGLHNHPSPQPNWDGFRMSWTTEWRKSSQQVLRICGNSFKTVGKAFHVKLVERIPRVCKAVIREKGGYLEESQIENIFWFV